MAAHVLSTSPSLLSLPDELLTYILQLLSPNGGDLVSCSSSHPRLLRLAKDQSVVTHLSLCADPRHGSIFVILWEQVYPENSQIKTKIQQNENIVR